MYIPLVNRFSCLPNQLNFFIKKLNKQSMYPILDYINEKPKDHENNFNTIKNLLKQYPNNFVAVKMSSLGINYKYSLAEDYCNELIHVAKKNNTKILIDAEYDSIQYFINLYSTQAMKNYNKDDVWVYKTYQMYRNDSFEILTNDFLRRHIKNDYYLGIKLVRGAYLNQDRKNNIIFNTKVETDNNYNQGVEFFSINSFEKDDLILATHNKYSIEKSLYLKETNKINNIKYSQLLGMSDNLSLSLVEQNQTVFKYLPYGNLSDSIPYLTRRLYENYDILKYLNY
jgi:proline dehydrogenase